MQQHNLPDPWEEVTTKNPVEFTVKPTGELIVKGSPSPDLLQQLINANDYHQDQNRRIKLEADRRIDEQSKVVNLMTLSFLGASFLVLIACFFLSFNNNNRQGNINYDGQSFQGPSCK